MSKPTIDFTATEFLVTEVLSTKVGGGTNPTLEMQVGGDTPAYTSLAIPATSFAHDNLSGRASASTPGTGENSGHLGHDQFLAIVQDNLLINSMGSVNQKEVSGTVVLAAGVQGHDGLYGGVAGGTYTFTTTNGKVEWTVTAGTIKTVSMITKAGEHIASWEGTAEASLNGGSSAVSPVIETLTGGTRVELEFGTGTFSLFKLEPGMVASPHGIDDNCVVESSQVLKRFERKNAISSGGPFGYVIGASSTLATLLLFHAPKLQGNWTINMSGAFVLTTAAANYTGITFNSVSSRSSGVTNITLNGTGLPTAGTLMYLSADADVNAHIDIDATVLI